MAKYNDWDHYRESHPEAADLMDSQHGFEFLTNMKRAVVTGRNITNRMQEAIDRCVDRSRGQGKDPDEELAARGVPRPEKGQSLEVGVRPYKLENKFDGYQGDRAWLVHARDQYDRPCRLRGDASLLRRVVDDDAAWDDLNHQLLSATENDAMIKLEWKPADINLRGNFSKLRVRADIKWTKGYFYIMDGVEIVRTSGSPAIRPVTSINRKEKPTAVVSRGADGSAVKSMLPAMSDWASDL